MQQRAVSEQSVTRFGFTSFEAEHRCKDGRLIWGEVFSKPDSDAQGAIVGYHGITREITQRKLLEDQVNQLAFHDPLTKLANRRLLEDHLSIIMSTSKRTSSYSSLAFLDLDNFKPLNDLYGHVAGDLLLIEVASRLKACVREIDTAARFGGDEFVVLLGDLSTDRDEAISQAAFITETIHSRLSAPYFLNVMSAIQTSDVVEHHCSASIGVTVFNGCEASQDEIIEWADSAMYEAKEAGRNQIRFHDMKS